MAPGSFIWLSMSSHCPDRAVSPFEFRPVLGFGLTAALGFGLAAALGLAGVGVAVIAWLAAAGAAIGLWPEFGVKASILSKVISKPTCGVGAKDISFWPKRAIS